MGEYGQFCPVAKAAEILDERWTLLVVRELVAGSSRFNDIHRGVPRMSRTLLSKRLSRLVSEGLVRRRNGDDGPVYELTDAGVELEQVVEVIGQWGIRWPAALSDHDLDPALLVWDMHRRVETDALPESRTVVGLTFDDVPARERHWWLVLTPDEADVCDHDPGFGTDVHIQSSLRTIVSIWRGELGWGDAMRADNLRIEGDASLRRQVPSWFQLSPFASVPRPTDPEEGAPADASVR